MKKLDDLRVLNNHVSREMHRVPLFSEKKEESLSYWCIVNNSRNKMTIKEIPFNILLKSIYRYH